MSTEGNDPGAASAVLSEQDLYDIVDGGCLFGSGGGGPRSLGQSLVKGILAAGKPVTLADPGAMPDGAMTAVSAGVGSPDAASSDFPYDAGSKAFDTLTAGTGTTFAYVLPGEVGAANSLVPMTTAASRGIPILDAAGSPRAMPKFAQATFAIHGVPIGTIALANAEVELWFRAGEPDEADASVRDAISSKLFTEDAGIAFWAMDGKTMRRTALAGTTTRARALGACLREALAASSAPVDAVCGFLGGRVLATGEIVHAQEVTAGGFDVGVVTVAGATGPALQVVNQNENLLAWFENENHPAVMSPDLIVFMTVAGEPFSNADRAALPKGTEVAVIAAPAPDGYRDKPIADAWLPLLQSAGYRGPFVPWS